MMMNLIMLYRILRLWSGAVVSFCICMGLGLFCEVAGVPPLRFAATRFERARRGVIDFPFVGAGGGIGPPPKLTW
jgi:hypothetical protein